MFVSFAIGAFAVMLLAIAVPATIPFILAFGLGITLAKVAIYRTTTNVVLVVLEAVLLGKFSHGAGLFFLFASGLAGLMAESCRFLYQLWKVGLLPHFVHQMQLKAVIRATVFAISEMPPGDAAVFYFFPEVEGFTLEVALLFQAVGWIVGLGKVSSGASGNQVVMCLRAPQDPTALRDSLVYLRRAGTMRIRAG